ncbi:MAG: hypothetical protein WB780_14535, partial [Candidatus Acidiferrales bacterium]
MILNLVSNSMLTLGCQLFAPSAKGAVFEVVFPLAQFISCRHAPHSISSLILNLVSNSMLTLGCQLFAPSAKGAGFEVAF